MFSGLSYHYYWDCNYYGVTFGSVWDECLGYRPYGHWKWPKEVRQCTIWQWAIFYGDIPWNIGLTYGRYLQFRFLKWPLIYIDCWLVIELKNHLKDACCLTPLCTIHNWINQEFWLIHSKMVVSYSMWFDIVHPFTLRRHQTWLGNPMASWKFQWENHHW